MRNGRYEPQNLMPVLPQQMMFDFTGFVQQRGPNGTYVNVRPPDMRQASLVKNPVSVRRASVHLVRPGAAASRQQGVPADAVLAEAPVEDGKVVLTFTFDAVHPGQLSVHLLVKEVEQKANPEENVGMEIKLVPQSSTSAPSSPAGLNTQEALAAVDTRDFSAGLGQVYCSPPFDLSRLPKECLGHDRQRPRDIPLAILLDSNGHAQERCVQYTYMGFLCVPQSSNGPRRSPSRPVWAAQVLAQKLQYGGQCFVLHEVFGVSPKQALDAELEQGNSDCVICLSEPRDTAVLPCRHMCFCAYCAGIVRLQCDRCPVCRQKVVSLLQFKRPPEEATDLLAKDVDMAAPAAAATSQND